jgi:hypothetical protein
VGGLGELHRQSENNSRVGIVPVNTAAMGHQTVGLVVRSCRSRPAGLCSCQLATGMECPRNCPAGLMTPTAWWSAVGAGRLLLIRASRTLWHHGHEGARDDRRG